MLLVPLIALAVARWTQSAYESALQEQVEAEYRSLAPDEQQEFATYKDEITLRNICSAPEAIAEFEFEGICSRYRNLDRVAMLAIATLLAPISLLTAVFVAGRAARSNRRLLLRLFRPLLAATLIMVVAVALSQAALAVAAIYYGVGGGTGSVSGRLMLMLAVGALAGVWSMIRVVPRAFESAEAHVLGKPVAEDHSPDLWREVRELCAQVGTDAPDTIVAGLDPTFFVTEVDVNSLDDRHSGRTLFVSLPLSRILTIDEFRGVIGHEMGHFKGEDTQYSQRFFPIYRGASDSLELAVAHATQGLSGLTMWPAVAILSFFLESFAVAESTISRDRELAADGEGAAVGGVEPFATALVKAHAFGGVWGPVVLLMAHALSEGRQIANASAVFESVVQDNTGPESLSDLEEQRLPHPTDSHPPLAVRLEALGVTMDDVSDAALATEPELASIELVEGHEELEEALSQMHSVMFAQAGHPVGRPDQETSEGESDSE
jgi:Zn-dependent protease with chaperone function